MFAGGGLVAADIREALRAGKAPNVGGRLAVQVRGAISWVRGLGRVVPAHCCAGAPLLVDFIEQHRALVGRRGGRRTA